MYRSDNTSFSLEPDLFDAEDDTVEPHVHELAEKENEESTRPIHPFFMKKSLRERKVLSDDSSTDAPATPTTPSETPASGSGVATPDPLDTKASLSLLDTHVFFLTPEQRKAQKLLQKQERLRKDIETSNRVTAELLKGKAANPFFQRRKYAAGEIGGRGGATFEQALDTPLPSRVNCHVGRMQSKDVRDSCATLSAFSRRVRSETQDPNSHGEISRLRNELDTMFRNLSVRCNLESRSPGMISPDGPSVNPSQLQEHLRSLYPSGIMNSVACSPLLSRLTETAIANPVADTDLWTEKYRPTNPFQVLGQANEGAASRISFWLNQWKPAPSVSSTDGDSDTKKRKNPRATDTTKTRKKRRGYGAGSDMDDFVVLDPSDTSSDELISSTSPTTHLLVRGPPGCGKTTLVHAAAAQAGYEVLEVNPGQRRSGKDLLGALEEATQSHAVVTGGTSGGVGWSAVLRAMQSEGMSTVAGVSGDNECVGEEWKNRRARREGGAKGKRHKKMAEVDVDEIVDILENDELSLHNMKGTEGKKNKRRKKGSRISKSKGIVSDEVESDEEPLAKMRPKRGRKVNAANGDNKEHESEILDVVGVGDNGGEDASRKGKANHQHSNPDLDAQGRPKVFIRLRLPRQAKGPPREDSAQPLPIHPEVDDSTPSSTVGSPPPPPENARLPPAPAAVASEHTTPLPPVSSTPPTARKTLILLEEADILSEQDKGFWPAVAGLIERKLTRPTPTELACYLHLLSLNERVWVEDADVWAWAEAVSGDVRKGVLGAQIVRRGPLGAGGWRVGKWEEYGETAGVAEKDESKSMVDVLRDIAKATDDVSMADLAFGMSEWRRFETQEPEESVQDGDQNRVYFSSLVLSNSTPSSVGYDLRATPWAGMVMKRSMRAAVQDLSLRSNGSARQAMWDTWKLEEVANRESREYLSTRLTVLSSIIPRATAVTRPRVFALDVCPAVAVMFRLDTAERSAVAISNLGANMSLDGAENDWSDGPRRSRRERKERRRYFEHDITAEAASVLIREWEKVQEPVRRA
ncbi:ATPase AAA domain-containing protein 5 [Borealophlyctis nickersoniae]|nr:ATPase AAA domain-containing protein 5 [Borealophlyctis nickersoniae]